MSEELAPLITSLWLGILTSISPCPLATNIAAISFVGRKIESRKNVVFTGLLYTLGRVTAYTVLGLILSLGILSVTGVSFSLQRYMNMLLGPIMILIGMVLLELISLRLPSTNVGKNIEDRAKRWGMWGALPLGFLFALSFCPVSAALFFGSLIPLVLKSSSPLLLPPLYGVGTAVPVIAFAIAISLGADTVGRLFEKTTLVEKWGRWATGVIFILIGIYFSLRYIFELF